MLTATQPRIGKKWGVTLIVSAGSSGLADRRWFHKAPDRAAEFITQEFADVATDATFRFNSGFGQPDAPCVLRPSKADAEFIDFTVLFDVSSWIVLTDATPSAESQILSSILAIGSLSLLEALSVRRRCKQLGIPLIPTTVDHSPKPEPLADFHPDARGILPDDIFWDCSNDYGPVGNDTGADILELYRQWRVIHDAANRQTFFDDLLAQWQLHPIQQLPSNSGDQTLTNSLYEILTWDDAIVGWALTQIACDGNVDGSVAHLAETAIARQSDPTITRLREWSSLPERLSTLQIVRDAIRSAPFG